MTKFFGVISIIVGLGLLTSCNYRPMYGEKTQSSSISASQGLAQTEIANIPDRAGQILRNDLIDRINYAGYADQTNYILEVSLNESRSDLGLKRDDTSSLYVYTITANARLKDKESGKVLKTFTGRAESSVNVVKEQFSILVAAETGRKRALKQIADILVNRVGLYFSTAHVKDTSSR